MGYQSSLRFPELVFTSPGTYTYTISELTPSDREWDTDDRVFRVIITVTDSGDGTLVASAAYPDGVPEFINYHKNPSNVCKEFNQLPFPMFLFAPPQKPEFMELVRRTPGIFKWWDGLFKAG